MESIRDFIDDYGFLTFGRDYISVKNYVFSLQKILISAELTISNMIDCCKNGCFADANILLRKYRDDLFFALYVVVYDASKKITTSIDNEKIEKNIEKWLQNNLSDLQINTVLKQVGNYPYVEKAVKKYNLQKAFSEISTRLNNFVHGNGFSFYNQNVLAYKDEELFDQLSQINEDLRFITITFLFLIILCSPLYIMSTDYIDFLEMGQTPPDGSQCRIVFQITATLIQFGDCKHKLCRFFSDCRFKDCSIVSLQPIFRYCSDFSRAWIILLFTP